MKKLDSIMGATDLSVPARHAIERAAMLARDLHAARFDVMHVVSMALFPTLQRLLSDEADRLAQQMITDAETELRGLADEIGRRYGVRATVFAKSGKVLDEILDAAEAAAADLVVLGARGANFVREFMLGTTAERIISKTTRPVLAVKQVPHEPYRHVLVPIDFSPYSKPALETAALVAPGARITLLHAFEAPFERQMRHASISEEIIHSYRVKARQQALKGMEALVSGSPLAQNSISWRAEYGDPSRVILESEQETSADLIVIGKHGESALEEFFLGSVTKHVLAYSNCDVLISGHAVA